MNRPGGKIHTNIDPRFAVVPWAPAYGSGNTSGWHLIRRMDNSLTFAPMELRSDMPYKRSLQSVVRTYIHTSYIVYLKGGRQDKSPDADLH